MREISTVSSVPCCRRTILRIYLYFFFFLLICHHSSVTDRKDIIFSAFFSQGKRATKLGAIAGSRICGTDGENREEKNDAADEFMKISKVVPVSSRHNFTTEHYRFRNHLSIVKGLNFHGYAKGWWSISQQNATNAAGKSLEIDQTQPHWSNFDE